MMKNKTVGSILDLAAAVLALIALAVYMVNGAGNVLVTFCVVLSLVCGVVYFVVDHPVADVGNLLGVVFIAIAMCNYLVDSIPSFLDYFNGITMFQSGGGMGTIVTLLVLMGISALVYIISCFMKRVKA